MTTLNFRLPAIRMEQRPLRRALAQRAGAPRVMNAEDAARIALRRLDGKVIELAAESRHEGVAADEAVSSGWFESTWELAKGLDISEGMPADLPLDGWLQIYLAA